MQELKTVKILWSLIGLYPWMLAAIILLGFLSSLSEGIGITLFILLLQSAEVGAEEANAGNRWLVLLNSLFDRMSPANRAIAIALLIFVSIFLKNFLVYSNSAALSWFKGRISHHLRSRIFRQFLTVNYSFLESNDSGKLMNTLSAETWQTIQALEVVVNLLICLITTIVFGILLLLISWKLTLVVAVGLYLISLAIHSAIRRTKRLGQQAVVNNKAFASLM